MDIRTLCLGILTFGDASGYEIKKTLQEPLRHFFDASFGSIYPALNRLTREGLVTCTAQVQAKRPEKKVYRITPQGREAFRRSLLQAPDRDRFRSEFVATLLFADQIPAQHVAGLLDERIGVYRRTIAEMEACAGRGRSVGSRFVNGMGLAVYRAALAYLEQNRHIVEAGPPARAAAPVEAVTS